MSSVRARLAALFDANRGAPNLWLADRAEAIVKAWAPTHRHRKGGLYRVIANGRLEADLTPVVIYDDAEGHVWVRPARDFNDGRFLPVDELPPAMPPAD